MLEPDFDGDIFRQISNSERFESTRQLIAQLGELLSSSSFSTVAVEKINSARDLALELHFHQDDRAGGEPYINHPLSVAITFIELFGPRNPDLIASSSLTMLSITGPYFSRSQLLFSPSGRLLRAKAF
jgi:hypothetical protein